MGRHPGFLLDVMLGRLARRLRALGHNAAYDSSADDPDLLRRAVHERRILVTRDTRLAADHPRRRIVLLHANDTPGQLRELVAALGITRHPGLLTRCIACNARLCRARPDEVEERVPEYVKARQRDFRACRGCGRIYWPGTHRRGILEALESALPGVTRNAARGSGLPEERRISRVQVAGCPPRRHHSCVSAGLRTASPGRFRTCV